MAINAGPRRGVNITGFFRQQNMLVLVLVVHALLAVACYCKAEEVDQSLTEFAEVKRKLKPDSSLEDWRKEGFALPERRGPEFEALRINKWSNAPPLKRVHARVVSPENFKTLELAHEPFVIDGIPEFYKWEAASWTIESLVGKYPTLDLRVGDYKKGSARMPLAEYARYMKIQQDDDPMYVFDDALYDDEIGKELMRQYSVPDIFSEDLWQLAKGHKNYPAYRWLLISPERSGSAPHNDPLGSSAWNTLISGRKLWFLAPPYFEEMVGDITGISAIKWFVDELPKLIAKHRDDIILYVQHPGETMLVPSFWMHAVLNLDDTIAVTQNFVSMHTFPEAWELARDHLNSFAQTWLQEMVIHREDLGLLALRMNASKNKQIRLQKQRDFDEL